MSLVTEPILSLGNEADVTTFTPRGRGYDCALGSIGLLRADSKEYPHSRGTAEFRKQQFDASSEPGEQSLSNWWLRSASSFHEGTGLTFMEPVSDETVVNGFAHSVGVNPWTPGALTLLRNTALKNATSGDCLVMGAIDGTTDVFFQGEGATLHRETSGGTGAVTWGGSGTIVSLTNDGANYYAADSTGIYKGTLAGGAGSLVWNTGSANTVIGWAKQRLVAGIGAAVYELTTGGPTLPTALYTHPSTAWKWTAIAETGSAIYVAGYNGSTSAVYRFTLSTAGVMPTLTSGVVAAQMPTGEQIHSMTAYLGYLVLGTNKGVRVCLTDDQGNVGTGPLTITSTATVAGLATRDRFVYAACTNQIDTKSGLWRIDLGSPRDDGTFPYATDLSSGVTGTVNSVSVFGASDRMVFGVSASGSYLESATDLVSSGYVRTGYIRFNTVEPKRFLYASMKGIGPGMVSLSTYDATGTTNSIISGVEPLGVDYGLARSETEEYLALTITLTQATTTTGPTLRSWQVRALPAITRSRLLQVPVMLFERMRNTKGTPVPVTAVHDTLTALEDLENDAAPVLFYDLAHTTPRTELVVIEEVRFQQTSPPARAKGEGGIVYLTLRTIQ